MRSPGTGLRLLPALAALLVLAGCGGATPPPPPLQPPAPVSPSKTYPQNGAKQLAVGVDDLGTGFNPHLISDVSPVTSAVAGLVLPSVFRPGPDGSLKLDSTVATSAQVTSTAPFTVSYELNVDAAWSDNSPIAAEDFVYLWQQMRSEPGVVDNAGYRLITDVRSRAGGKAVDVVFSQPDEHWRELFSDLLPAHLLKDAPAWRTALADSLPVSGGPFQVSQVDRARGQLVLMRNDHYWGTPSVLDSLTLRRTDATSMVEGLRSGDLPVVQTWADTSVIGALGQLGSSVRLQPVAEPIVVQLAMRTDEGVLSDVRVRQAIGALLNRDQLIAIGTGNGAGGVPANAQLLAPSEPGYRATAPAGAPVKQDPALATQLLTAAGYAKDAQGQWAKENTPLKIVIGVPTGHPRFAEIAREARHELAAAGVAASVVTAPGPVLYTEPTVVDSSPQTTAPPQPSEPAGPPLAAGTPKIVKGGPGTTPAELVGPGGLPAPTGANQTPGPGPIALGQREARAAEQGRAAQPPPAPAGVAVDLMVMPRAVGSDVITTAVSNYGCPPGMAGVAQPARNPSGFCSPGLQPTLSAALAGGIDATQAAASIETTLWQQLPVIPLFQVVTTLASTSKGDRATGNIAPGPLTLGPFSTAVRWQPVSLPKPGS